MDSRKARIAQMRRMATCAFVNVEATHIDSRRKALAGAVIVACSADSTTVRCRSRPTVAIGLMDIAMHGKNPRRKTVRAIAPAPTYGLRREPVCKQRSIA